VHSPQAQSKPFRGYPSPTGIVGIVEKPRYFLGKTAISQSHVLVGIVPLMGNLDAHDPPTKRMLLGD
jgi:hypothetical protein